MNSEVVLAVFAAAAVVAPALSTSAAEVSTYRECAKIDDSSSRLACYDALSGREREVGSRKSAKWLIDERVNPLDDSKTVIAVLVADTGRGTYGDPVTLTSLCRSNKTQLYIDFGSYLGSDSSSVYSKWKYITIRVGSADARKEKWGVSTDHKAAFAPRAIRLLKEMLRADDLVVQVVPYGSNPITAVFDLSGMRSAITPLAETCHWSLG